MPDNKIPTSADVLNNPNPKEHVILGDNGGSALSDEAALEQQMQQAFANRQQQLTQQSAPVTPQQAPAQQPPAQEVPPTTQQPQSDLAAQIEQTFLQSEEQASQQPESQTEQPPEEATDRVKYLQQVFKDTLGVDVGEAVSNMNSFNETAQTTMQNLEQVQQNIALQQQRLDLMYAWGHEAQQYNTTAQELVNQRLAETTRVYNSLNENLRKRIAAKGSEGIIDLYNLIQKNRGGGQPQQQAPQMTVPAGRASIAATPQNNGQAPRNLSELIATKSDDDFWNNIVGGFNDDLGVIRRR